MTRQIGTVKSQAEFEKHVIGLPFKRKPEALTIVVLGKLVSMEEDCIDVIHLDGMHYFIQKPVIKQIARLSKDVNEMIKPLLKKFYTESPKQMEQIQNSFSVINHSFSVVDLPNNRMKSINLKIHSVVSDLKTILSIYKEMEGVDSRIIAFHQSLHDYLVKFSARGFWKKYRAMDPDFERKLETISKMY